MGMCRPTSWTATAARGFPGSITVDYVRTEVWEKFRPSFIYRQGPHAPSHDGAHIPSHGGLHDINAAVHAAHDACHDATQCAYHAYHALYACQYSECGGGIAVGGSSKLISSVYGSGSGRPSQSVSGGFWYSSSYTSKPGDV